MIVKIKKYADPFVRIARRTVEDCNLTWEARGMLAFLLAKPDNWEINANHLIECSPNAKRDKVRAILRELIESGYLHRIQPRGRGGKMEKVKYYLFEIPVSGEQAQTGKLPADGLSASGCKQPSFFGDLAADGFTGDGPTGDGSTGDGEAVPIITNNKRVTNKDNNSSSRGIKTIETGEPEDEPESATTTVDEDVHVIPSPEECNWSFLSDTDQEHLPLIKTLYHEFRGDLDKAGWESFSRHNGRWNGIRMAEAVQISKEMSHEAAFAAIIICGSKGKDSLSRVAKYFTGNGSSGARPQQKFMKYGDVISWRREAGSSGQNEYTFMEVRSGVSVNAHGQFLYRGSAISEQDALKMINGGRLPFSEAKSEKRRKAPTLRDLGRGVTFDPDKKQYYVSGRAVDKTYADKVLQV